MKLLQQTRLNDFSWTLFPSDCLCKSIIDQVMWEPHILSFMRAFIKPGDIVIDAGACFGWHTLEMARLVGPDGTVFAFEPCKANRKLLVNNIQANRFTNVVVSAKAVGEAADADARLFVLRDEMGNIGDNYISPASLPDPGPTFYPMAAPVTTIDIAVCESPIKFMKVDVQGAEILALKGASKTITSSRPVMTIEFEDISLNRYGITSFDLRDYIYSLDYVIYQMESDYPADTICVPNEKNPSFRETFANQIKPNDIQHKVSFNNTVGVPEKIAMILIGTER